MSCQNPAVFPRLAASSHQVTSPRDPQYNCIAWAAEDDSKWWQPGSYWPITPVDVTVEALQGVFEGLGYSICADGSVEVGLEKVVLYGNAMGEYTHAARQLSDGRWTSKLGRGQDITHTNPEDVAGGSYGTVAAFLSRPQIATLPVATA